MTTMNPCEICTESERAACLCRYPEFAFFREWMASGDPLKQMHVRNRSRLPYEPPTPSPAPAAPIPAVAVAPALPDPRPILDQIPLAGDVAEKVAKGIGADRLAKWYERKTGRSCHCKQRQEALNNATRVLIRWAARRR